MQYAGFAAVSIAFCAGAAMAQDLAPDVLLHVKVKNRVLEELRRLPNISCLETVQREYQPPGGTFRPVDTVRLEVLASGRKESFSLPGERNFSEQHPATYSSGGMFGDGIFGHYLQNVLSGNVSYRYKGEEAMAGRRLARFDYRLPAMWSKQTITVPEGSGIVGFHGSYWVDPESYDVMRLDLNADEFPPTLPIAEMAISIKYARVHLSGDQAVLLPESADIRLVKYSGEIKHNRAQFTDCRVFAAESTISFGESNSVPNKAPASAPQAALPAGLEVAVKLKTPITTETAVGATIEGVVAGNVRLRKGGVVIAAGAPVRGRVRRLERNTTPYPYFSVALEITEVQLAGDWQRFHADLSKVGSTPAADQMSLAPSRTDFTGLQGGAQSQAPPDFIVLSGTPGVGEFIARGRKLNLPQGFRTVWVTRSPAP